MSARDWEEVEALFNAALERPPEERTAWVEARASDPDAAHEALSLLAAHARPGLFDALIQRQDEVDRGTILPAGTRVGAWEIEGELGRGGMGVVYRARRADGEYEQEAALKILARDPPGAEAGQRFRTERQILAGLSHPSIARLLDGGVAPDGRPYYVMEIVDGKRIDRYCDDRDLDTAARVRLFLDVCDAVQAAHASLIIHRDLKPGNILVDGAGKPKLLDFGIAKSLDPDDPAGSGDASTVTRVGARVLTPEYASPEQLRGDPVTTASDVYQLGLLLYDLLASPAPYERWATSGHRIGEHIGRLPTRRPPVQASGLPGRELNRGLDDILLRALAPDPVRRYPTAGELAADLRRHLSGRRVGTPPWRAPRVRRIAAVVAVAIPALAAAVYVSRPTGAERDRSSEAAAGPSGASSESPDTPTGAPVEASEPATSRVLWVDDDPENNVAQVRRLRDVGIEVQTALSTGDALSRYDPGRFQLVVSDMGRYEGPGGVYHARAGLDLLSRLQAESPDVRLVFCTSRRAVAEYGAEALAAGAIATYTNCDDVVALLGFSPLGRP